MNKVEHPSHYNSHPSGIECMEIVKYMPFPEGNVIKYVWRAPFKENRLEDLKKAMEYLKVAIDIEEKRIALSYLSTQDSTVAKPDQGAPFDEESTKGTVKKDCVLCVQSTRFIGHEPCSSCFYIKEKPNFKPKEKTNE